MMRPFKLRPAVPVAPGPEGASVGIVPACVACGCATATRVPVVLDEIGTGVLCLDPVECAKRYRRGMSAESFAAGLRGEILAVAP